MYFIYLLQVYGEDGTVRSEDKVLKITVKPGWKSGTRITFAKEGDQTPGKIPADIAFIIRDKPHPLFSRDGANLKFTYKLPLRDALCGTVVQVPTLGTTPGVAGPKVGVPEGGAVEAAVPKGGWGKGGIAPRCRARPARPKRAEAERSPW